MKKPKEKINTRYPVGAIELSEDLAEAAGIKNVSKVNRAIYAIGLNKLTKLIETPDKLNDLINKADKRLEKY